MLLPSDVARLVLGYLQEEGLSATSRAFIRESPNLKEYAEHSTEDGAIPACVFSLFGKGLTTILNEYVAAKAKESIHEVPAMMTSLWKKLEFTLNQIKSLLNSPAISASQRMRSRVGVRDLRRQRASTLSTAGSFVCAPAPKTSPIINPVHPTHSVLGHSTPGSYTTLQTRPASVSDTHFQIQEGDSPVQMLVPEHRLTPGPMSPGRRKWDSPRKRGSGLSGSSGTGRSTMNVSSLAVEPQPEEVVEENFPQLVIENAREKILGDRSLQEKLAENINKILACDPTPQTSKASCSTVEPDQSIDEILGLQGEIHMSDDAIHDILEQTESDPAFQALFDLFDYNKTRITEGELGYEDISSSPEESETAGPSSADRPPQNEDPVAAKPKPPTINPSTPSKGSSDSSNIVSLKIIICDDQDEASSSDVALSQAISSISTDKIPTIFLSSPAKATLGPPGTPSANQDETAQAVSSLQSSEVLQPTGTEANPLSGKTGVAVVSTLAGASQAQPSYILQLPLDTTNPALPGSTTSYFLLTDPSATDPQARQVLLPTGISKGQPLPPSQYTLATPPRSQGFSTGSTLILQSPGHGQPVMLPVSVMAQSTLGKFQMVSNQLVAIPSPLAIQQSETVQPKTPTVMLKQSTVSGITGTTEENSVSKVVPSLSTENPGQKVPAGTGPSVTPRIGDGHRRILCFDSSGEAPPSHPTKITTTSTPPAENTQISRSVQLSEKDNPQLAPRTKPAILSGNKPKRRIEAVRCSDDTQAGLGFETEKETEKSMPPKQQQKDPVRKTLRKQDHKIHDQKSQSASASRVDISEPESLKKSESGGRSKALDRNHRNNDCNQVKSKDSHSSRSLSSDYIPKSGSRKEKEEASKKEPAEKAPAKSREGRAEKRTSSQVEPNVTANKENEVEGSRQEQQQQSTPSSAPREFSPPSVIPPTPTPQSKSSKIPSKTSSLAKQAAEMLQDIQGLNSPTPVKKPGVGYSDLPLPRTPGSGCNEEDIVDCPRTPARQRQGREGEVTPRHLLPPTTPELPTCSPASEAGSENSINMAAHTLMILSRAAIARTGTPLKDSLRQEGVGKTSPATSKKKRKLMSPPASPPAKKESKGSVSSKKQEKKQKKLLDYFPDNLDVDKFLSSLHYDE
ncbi:protein NPAT [Diretmus argenteus]